MQTSEQTATMASFSGVWEVRECSGLALQLESPRTSLHFSDPLGMSLRDWLLLIPNFIGCSHALERFSEAVRYVRAQLGPGLERTLLLALGPKLTGRARALFSHRLHRAAGLEELLETLRASFGDFGAEVGLLKELHSARQEVDEATGEFGARLDKLVTRLCGIYEADQSSEESLREMNKNIVRRAALVSFLRGLRSAEVEVRVGVWEPRTLDEATRIAVAIENGMRSVGQVSSVRGSWRRKYRCR